MLFNSLSTIGFPKLVCPFTSAILKSPGFATWLTYSWKRTPRKHGIWNDASQKVISSTRGSLWGCMLVFGVLYPKASNIKHPHGWMGTSLKSSKARSLRSDEPIPKYLPCLGTKKNIRSVAWRHVATANVVVNSLLKHSKNTNSPLW